MRRTVKRDSIGHYVVALGLVFRPPARHDYSDRLSVAHKTGERVTVTKIRTLTADVGGTTWTTR